MKDLEITFSSSKHTLFALLEVDALLEAGRLCDLGADAGAAALGAAS